MEITSWETTVHKCVCLCVDNGTRAGGICLSPSRGCFDQYLWSNLKGSIRWQKCKQRAYSQIAHNVIHNATDPHPYTHPADPHPKCCWSYIFHKNHWFPFTAGSFHFIYGCSVWVSDGLGTWLVGWLADWLAGLLVASKEFRAPHTRTHLNSYHHHIYTIPCCMMGSRIGFTGLSKPQALNETRRNGACVPYADVHIFIYLFLLFNTLALTHPFPTPL